MCELHGINFIYPRDIVNICGLDFKTIFRLGCRFIDLFHVHEKFTRHDERDKFEAT